jgi:hypothetical protein
MDSYNSNCRVERMIALGTVWFCVGVAGVVETLLILTGY